MHQKSMGSITSDQSYAMKQQQSVYKRPQSSSSSAYTQNNNYANSAMPSQSSPDASPHQNGKKPNLGGGGPSAGINQKYQSMIS